MTLLVACITGLLAGTHAATWGMYKDAPHEGFELRKYLRSIVLGGLIAPALVLAGMSADGPGSLVLLFGVTYVIERAIAEFYKTFIRDEDQSKYSIPMQLAVRGRLVQGRRVRLQTGVVVAVVAAAVLAAVGALDGRYASASLPLVLSVGSLGGWFSAFGGAWKDAPHEGFQTLKFFRSPLLAAAYTLALSPFADSFVLAAAGGLGFTIATLETWKTFCFPSKPRGKFAGKAMDYPAVLVLRNRFVPLYAGIWVLVVAAYLAAWRAL